MADLSHLKCVACRGGEPSLTDAQIAEYLPQVPGWQVLTVEGEKRLQRLFSFPNFVTALTFTDKVGAIAEEQDHHPMIITEWGKVTVQWWTHKNRGLHQNDFIMAARTNDLLKP